MMPPKPIIKVPSLMPFDFIQAKLDERVQHKLLRTRRALVRLSSTKVATDKDTFLDFSSNDYLGMSQHQDVISAANTATVQYGIGSGGSSMITGYSKVHQALEEYLAHWLGFERCMLFSSGFAANTGVIETLMVNKDDLLIQDKLNHASLIDGGRHCQAKSVRFAHNDMDALKRRLQQAGNNKLVVSEGVFSMDGDSAVLDQVVEHTKACSAGLMVDDAHGLGVLGEQGKGTLSHFGLNAADADIYMATFGKAVGTGGAFVAGSTSMIEYLLQFCRHYTYSTAMPPALAQATLTSLQIIAQDSWRREKLQSLIAHFKFRLNQIGLPDNQSSSAIQPILIGDTQKTLAISEGLKKSGIWLTAIRPPTVPQGTSRLRVTLNCDHQTQDIDFLFEQLEALI